MKDAGQLQLRLLSLGLAFVTATLLAACSAASVPVTPSVEATRSSEPVDATPSPRPTGSSDAGARTLRTIAGEPAHRSPLTVGRLFATNDFYDSHAATYASDGLTISAVLLQPSGPGSHPGVVLVHGLVDPASYTSGGELKREQEFFARAGYFVLAPDLRGLAGSDPGPDGPPDLEMGTTEDVINAVAALAGSGLPGLNPGRIGLLGHSLGGLLVLDVLAARPGLVDAAVAFAPSGTDPYENVQHYLTPGDPLYEAIIAAHGTPATNAGYWADISPRTFVDRVTDPLLIVHGDADEDAPYASSVDTVAILRKAGKDVEFVTLKGEGHVFDARWGEAMAASTAFFSRNLR